VRALLALALLLTLAAPARAQTAPPGAFVSLADVDASIVVEMRIASRSGHSRGSTVDLTLVKLPPRRQERYRRGDRLRDCAGPRRRRFRDNTIDMGTGYDCFDPLSHLFAERFRGKVRRNRLALREPMIRAGFKGLATEWWHFTLRDEPYPERFFDFPVEK
jgi:D-alanyl-D-alanine dipeptidase